jgi:hypothetical protein
VSAETDAGLGSLGSQRDLARTPLNTVVGTDMLCAWQPAPGITWVQTRSPQFARKLSQRNDARLVVRGVAGGYLRTFEFAHPLAWAQRLIARYTRNEKTTNARGSVPVSPACVSENEGRAVARSGLLGAAIGGLGGTAAKLGKIGGG